MRTEPGDDDRYDSHDQWQRPVDLIPTPVPDQESDTRVEEDDEKGSAGGLGRRCIEEEDQDRNRDESATDTEEPCDHADSK